MSNEKVRNETYKKVYYLFCYRPKQLFFKLHNIIKRINAL